MKRLTRVQLGMIACSSIVFALSLIYGSLAEAVRNVLLASTALGVIGLTLDHLRYQSFGKEILLASLVLVIGCGCFALLHPLLRSVSFVGFIGMFGILLIIQVRLFCKKYATLKLVDVINVLAVQLVLTFSSLALLTVLIMSIKTH